MGNFSRTLAFWLVIAIIAITMYNLFNQPIIPKRVEITYSQFLEQVKASNVERVTLREKDLEGELRTEITDRDKEGRRITFKRFKTRVPFEDPNLIKTLEEKRVKINAEPPEQNPWWLNLLISWFPLVIFIVVWVFFVRQMQGVGNKALSFGKSRAKLHHEGRPKVTFADVAGVDEAKEELQEVIEFLKDPQKFQRLGGKIPKGVLLVGPPGSGKTLLAKAIAGEAGVPFLSISGSDFVEMFVGVGASRVRDLFEQGKRHAPCIIFIDELDAVGRHRGAGLGGGHDEREQTLNQLLVEMDGFDTKEGVILIAATNRPDILDPALLRPGRFDRHIVVDKPDLVGREAILKVHTRKVPLAKEVDLKVLARRTPGFSGADLANLVNEAALLAARRNKKYVEMEELEEAIDRVIAGPERKSRVIGDKEKRIVAYHESGHALVAKMIPGTNPVHKVSIIPRGVAALGYTLQLPVEDRYLATKSEILNEITVLLGGRAAEDLIFSEISTGARNDLERATEAAHKMVCEYGMSDKLGALTLGRKHEEVFLGRDIFKERNFSEKTAQEIDREVRKIIDECYEKARKVLIENRTKLERLAGTLLEREVLEGEEVEKILNGMELAGDQTG